MKINGEQVEITKRCQICGKHMWWWQAIWCDTSHLKCAMNGIHMHTMPK